MMEFLDKIYSYENFGIILFLVITALVVIFLIVLFFGKKDEKKRELEATKKLEQLKGESLDAFAQISEEPAKIEGEVSSLNEQTELPPLMEALDSVEASQEVDSTPLFSEPKPIIEEAKKDSFETPIEPVISPVINEELINPVLSPIEEPAIAPIMEPEIKPVINEDFGEAIKPIEPTPIFDSPMSKVEETPEIKIPEFNFDELAASIASELESIERKDNQKTVSELINEEVKLPVVDLPTTPVEVPITPIKEVVKPTPGPITFSSVYINKPATPVAPITPEPIKVVESPVEPVIPVVNEPVAPIVHQEVIRPVVKPEIELPKPAEMPALKSEVKPAVEPIKEVTAVPDFSQFEGESYDIK